MAKFSIVNSKLVQHLLLVKGRRGYHLESKSLYFRAEYDRLPVARHWTVLKIPSPLWGTETRKPDRLGSFFHAPGMGVNLVVKVRCRRASTCLLAEGKGVHREVGSGEADEFAGRADRAEDLGRSLPAGGSGEATGDFRRAELRVPLGRGTRRGGTWRRQGNALIGPDELHKRCYRLRQAW
ncbi:MAG: hypothetical protein PWQ39_1486 [Thermacetogenium sp.]|nr:hypothetical protein [Thermacetogenium sp.]